MKLLLQALVMLGFSLPVQAGNPQPIPKLVDEFVFDHCLDCHDSASEKGDLNLELKTIDWTDPHARIIWTKVHHALSKGEMPPANKTQPSKKDREAIIAWLDQTLTKNVPPGGTVLRRLNREEYENTVRDVLGIPFSVPRSFPADTESHGFDNIGEGLVLSPPLMAQYLEIATSAADQLLPPLGNQQNQVSKTYKIGPGDFTLNFTTGHEIEGVLRMVSSSDPLARGSVWPNRFEAKVPGIYEVGVDFSAFNPGKDHTPIVHLLAHSSTGQSFTKANSLRKLAKFTIQDSSPKTFRASVELQRGETIVIHYENAPLHSDKSKASTERISQHLLTLFRDDPQTGAAWMKAGYRRSDRGWSWWKRINKIRNDGKVDGSKFDPDSKEVKTFAMKIARQGVNTVEALCCFRFFTGPGIDIHRMSVTGPTQVIEDDEARKQNQRTARFLGERNELDDADFAKAILGPVLSKAFRRPATDEQVARYAGIALAHQAQGHRFEDGLHLALRALLCSPHFLFREYREGPLDDFDLAARLSYFLTSSPPDATLRKIAVKGELSNPVVLEAQTRRLLNHNLAKNFLSSFTGQWLDLRKLPDIMPDTRLLNWIDKDLSAVTAETQLFVAEILRKNLPVDTFIDSDFTYLNQRNAALYKIKFSKSEKMKRVTLEPDSIRGGILTQASVLMATANGVDTQPVLRGAWMLENIFGLPTPEPPSDIPAIEPDTTGAKTIRELLDRHKADTTCASCHQKIDPPGFVLENFDPIGRWRDFYPVYQKSGKSVVTKQGNPVDALGTMPDGTAFKDVTDLKRYLIKNIDIFSCCLSDKLLTYATGRPMNFGDKKVIDRVVAEVKKDGNGFADLIVALVMSESFHSK